MKLSILIDSTLFSYSQIFFSNRRWFGFLVLLASFINPLNGAVILFSVLLTNLIALLFNYDIQKIRDGFYGFNGLLFGAALSFFYKPNDYFFPILLLFIILTFFVNTSIENYFAYAFNLPGLSLPFIISFYIFSAFNNFLNFFDFKENFFAIHNNIVSLPDWVNQFFYSLALLILQPNVISGVIIFIAILLFSRIMSILALFGFLISNILIQIFNLQEVSLIKVVLNFNAIITSIAVGGSLILPSNRSLLISFLSILLVFVFTIVFLTILSPIKLSVLVLPFNFVVLLIIYALKFREKQGEIVLLYFKPGSPEENSYYHKNRIARFEKYKFITPSPPFNGEWFCSQGVDGEFTHKLDWRYAYDFIVIDENNKSYKNRGDSPEDYYCYSLPVVSPYKGKVVRVVDNVEENEIGKINIKQNWGNTVIIEHGAGIYSAISHLKKNSIKVKEGDEIEKGTIIGLCGNSGRSPEPHVHFQFQKNDKIGGATLNFPFGHFLKKNNGNLQLISFDVPQKGDMVQNLEIDPKLLTAFEFEYGDKLKVEMKLGGKISIEYWEIKIDTYNIPYFESSKGSIATFYNDKEVSYFTSYIGKKKDALYHFYLAVNQVPFAYKSNLCWNDYYPISLIASRPLMILSDILILAFNPFVAQGEFFTEEVFAGDVKYKIVNNIELTGKGLFNFVHSKRKYETYISEDGFIIKVFGFINNQQFVNIKFIKEE